MIDEKDKQVPPMPAQMQQELSRLFDVLLRRKIRQDINSVYANQINFELSELDIKCLFGQLNQGPPGTGTPSVEWHTAVTMAFAEAKLLSFYLRINIAIHEATHGPIKIPAGILPEAFTAPEDMETNPTSKKMFEAVEKIRHELMEEQSKLARP